MITTDVATNYSGILILLIHMFDNGDYPIMINCDIPLFDTATSQECSSIQQITGNTQGNKIDYQKTLQLKIPVRFAGYDKVVKENKVKYYYPQGIVISPDDKSFFISYSSSAGKKSKVYFVEYDFKTGRQVRYFKAGRFYAQSFAIIYGKGRKYLYTTSQPKYGSHIAMYDISNIDQGHEANIVKEFNAPTRTEVSSALNHFYVVSKKASRDADMQVLKYDENFKPVQNMSFARLNSVSSDELPKEQGIAVGSDFFVASFGGFANGKPNYEYGKPFSNIGVVKYSFNGKVIKNNMCPSNIYKDLVAKYTNQPSTRLENEGVTVDSRGNIYTLVINNTSKDADMFVIKEFVKKSSSSLDFSSCIS